MIFPIKDLDLTRYVPYRPPTGKEDLDDPRTQVGPFKYDLYGVSNHMGTLSSGHCEWDRDMNHTTAAGLRADPRHGVRQELDRLDVL